MAEIAGYTIEHILGSGAMGSVYAARDAAGRLVALKLIRERSDAQMRRFDRERQALARLYHPNIVRYIDSSASPPVLVMEHVDGEDLRAILEMGPIPAERARRIAGEIASALAHAHAARLIHRDL